MFSTPIIVIHKHFQEAMIFKNYFFMVKSTVVQPPLLVRLATVSVLEAGGKPSTWFPPGALVEPTRRHYLSVIIFYKIWRKIRFFQKNHENHENHRVYPKPAGTQ